MREGWQRLALREAADVTIGRQRSPKNAIGPSMVPYMRAANVKDGRLVLTDVLEMNFTVPEQETYRLRPGDVLVTEGCGSIRELGASARWDGQLDGTVCFQNTLLRLRARPGVTLPEFLEQWARWAHKSGIWASAGSGTNIFHIGMQRAREISLLVPSVRDQRRIIDLIEAADAVHAGCVAESAATDDLVAALIEDGLSSTDTVSTLGDLIHGIEAGKSPPAEDRQPQPGEMVVLKVSAVRPGYFDPTEVKVIATASGFAEHARLRPGDLLITRANTRALVGSVCRVDVAPSGYYLCDKTLRLVPNEEIASPDYLLFALQSRGVRQQIEDAATGTSASMKNISQASIRSIRIPVMPRPHQEPWASSVRAATEQARAATRNADGASSLRAALLADLLSGAHEIPSSYDELLERAS